MKKLVKQIMRALESRVPVDETLMYILTGVKSEQESEEILADLDDLFELMSRKEEKDEAANEAVTVYQENNVEQDPHIVISGVPTSED